jgi:achaete-scute complex protein
VCRYEAERHTRTNDPYSPLCMIPLPGALALHAASEPSFIRKRNERERERVRCVNEGYEKLKEHLPSVSKEKRISKVI